MNICLKHEEKYFCLKKPSLLPNSIRSNEKRCDAEGERHVITRNERGKSVIVCVLCFYISPSHSFSYLHFSPVAGGSRINFKRATCVRQIRFTPRAQDVQREQRMPITGRYIPAYIRLHSVQRLENKQHARSLLVVRQVRSA